MSDSLQNPARGWKFWLALALVSLLVACMALVVVPRLRIETNLLALLPSTAENQVQLGAVRRFAERSSRELVFVVGTSERAKLKAAGLAFADALEKSGAFARIDYLVDDRYIAAAHAERKFRSAMLSRTAP
jgi:predicted exporter